MKRFIFIFNKFQFKDFHFGSLRPICKCHALASYCQYSKCEHLVCIAQGPCVTTVYRFLRRCSHMYSSASLVGIHRANLSILQWVSKQYVLCRLNSLLCGDPTLLVDVTIAYFVIRVNFQLSMFYFYFIITLEFDIIYLNSYKLLLFR